jgi:hypothetical protein
MDGLRLSKTEHRRLSGTLHQTHDVRVYKRTLAVLECARQRSRGGGACTASDTAERA